MIAHIFDLDGTLLDSKLVMAEIFDEIHRELQIRISPIDSWKSDISKGGECLIRSVFPEKGLNSKEILKIFREKYQNRKHSDKDFFPYAIRYLKMIQNDGYLMLVTNKPRGIVNRILRDLGISETFQFSWCRGEEDCKKPSDGLVELLNKITAKAKCEAIYYYGDSYVDRDVALKLKNCTYYHHRFGYEELAEEMNVFDFKGLVHD